jgi:hypothetical protein
MFNLKINKTMVTIVDYKNYEREDGEKFNILIVQGGVEAVKSRETGKIYLTARTARVSSTFNEITCKALIGNQLPGEVKKVESDPYEYTVKDTGEVIMLTHRFEYVDEQEQIVQDNYIEEEAVV